MTQARVTPISVKVLACICCVQIVYLVAVAVWGISASAQPGQATVIASFYFLVAAALGVGAGAVWRGQRFGQPLVLVWQLFAVIIGVQTALGGAILEGLVTLVLSATALLLLFSRSTLSHVTR